MWCSAASPTSCPKGVTLLAESATHAKDIDRDEIARRIQEAREDLADSEDLEQKSRIEEYLHQLTMLEGVIIPG